MPPRLRLSLGLIGLALMAFSLTALTYALWPTSSVVEQIRPAPALFVPPP